jgi:xanthine dehydrogenase large subunit
MSAKKSAVDKAQIHESAHLHVAGSAIYVDDILERQGTLHAAFGLSSCAHGNILSMDFSAVLQAPGVIKVLTAGNIPGENNCGPILHDDPILAESTVHYVGQPIFVVVAQTHLQARSAARLARIAYQPLPAVLDAELAANSGEFVVPPIKKQRGDVSAAIAHAPRNISGKFTVGGQEQFYLEGQISYAVPLENNGLQIFCSTQHPTEMQHHVAHCLNVPFHQVSVETRRMGGAFGGKESQSAIFACAAALAAQACNAPVKLRPDRDDDMLITGKRHDFSYAFEAGFDATGLLHGVKFSLIARAGFSADLSGPVAARALCHVDNAYYLSAVDVRVMAARTNTQSNTAFRGFGGPQGALAIEYVLDTIAHELGLDSIDVRRRNFYDEADHLDKRCTTHYDMRVEDFPLRDMLAKLEASSDYWKRRAEVSAFNDKHGVLRRGLALTPVKFGISFNVNHYNQAGALVHIYTDGTVLVNHGGTEMGQGLHTKIVQVVAHEFGLPFHTVRITATDTTKVPNTSATAASSGTDLNGKAAQNAAQRIKARLSEFAQQKYGDGELRFVDGEVEIASMRMSFQAFIAAAYQARVQLWSDGFYATPKIHWNRETISGRPFFYFAYGLAATEVVVDTLTGEHKCLRVDILHDAGASINPALDIGQIEGGFIQGMGWLTTEELVWNKEGKLVTHAPSTYKIPTVNDCPKDFRVALYDQANREDTIFKSKAVGEPPLLLAFSVFFAIRDAISYGLKHAAPLNAPATPEAVLHAYNAAQAASVAEDI